MDQTSCHRIAAFLFLILLHSFALYGAITVCEYEPPESRVSDLLLQGTFNWYDGPYADDRNRSISASLVGDYSELLSTSSFGRSLDARTEIRGSQDGWSADLTGSGSLQTFLADDVFGVGGVGIALSDATGLELDLTGGIGTGRFREVTPLAQAIRIQNDLLDLGELLAPVGDEVLLAVAQILGEVGPSGEEKVVECVDRLVATGLIAGGELGIRGLLAVEEVLESSTESRLCGSDVQARLGASAMLSSAFSLSATGILLVRYAAVPDPVSQFESTGEWKVRIARPEQMSINADATYVRNLPEGWTARAAYRVSIDRMWTDTSSVAIEHVVSASLTTQIFESVGLSLVGDAQHRTGDEEITLSVAVHLEAALF